MNAMATMNELEQTRIFIFISFRFRIYCLDFFYHLKSKMMLVVRKNSQWNVLISFLQQYHSIELIVNQLTNISLVLTATFVCLERFSNISSQLNIHHDDIDDNLCKNIKNRKLRRKKWDDLFYHANESKILIDSMFHPWWMSTEQNLFH